MVVQTTIQFDEDTLLALFSITESQVSCEYGKLCRGLKNHQIISIDCANQSWDIDIVLYRKPMKSSGCLPDIYSILQEPLVK